MADRSRDFYQALVQIDERFDEHSIADNGAGATDGDYTQRGPRAGVPEDQGSSDMVLQATGTPSQDGDLEIVASRAGMPDDRAELIWRDVGGGDSTSEYYGWEGPELLTHWEVLKSATSSAVNAETYLAAIGLADGSALAVTGQNGTTSGTQYPIYLHRYTPAAGWSALSDVTPSSSSQTLISPALVQLPSGVVLMALESDEGDNVDIIASEDGGASWSPYAYRVLDTAVGTADIRNVAMAYAGHDLLMVVGFNDGASFDAAQYASSDLGKSFSQISASYKADSPDADQAQAVAVCAVLGGFVVGWLDRNGGEARTSAIGSAWQSAATSAKVDHGAHTGSTTPGCALLTRPTGEVWFFFGATGGVVIAYTSDDAGSTWDSRARKVAGRLQRFAVAECGGRGLLITRWTCTPSNTYQPHSTACAFLGGYTRITMPAEFGARRDEYQGWNQAGWYPNGDPDDIGANVFTGATLTVNSGYVNVSASSQRLQWKLDTSPVSIADCYSASAVFAVNSITAAYPSRRVGVELFFGDNGSPNTDVGVSLSADTTQFWLFDEKASAAVGSPVSIDMTDPLEIRIVVSNIRGTSAYVKTWYRRPGSHLRTWTEGPGGSLQNSGGLGSPAAYLNFGTNAITQTSDADWYFAGIMPGTHYVPRAVQTAGQSWTNPDDLRGIPASGAFQAVTDGVSVRAVDGPACVDDSWRVRADYAYPIASILPSYKSSPDQPWRSVADGAQMLIPFDPEPDFGGDAGTEVKAFLFAFVNCNIKEAYIEGYNGTLWTQVARLRAWENFSGLKYSREGRLVQVDTGQSQTADRYFFRELHAGDTFDFGTSDPVVLRKIAHNTEGAFTDSATVRPTIVLADDDLSGSEPSSGTGSVWRRDFAAVVYQTSTYQAWRIRIPAHKTADGYYQIGNFVIGSPAIFGTPTDRGFSNALRFNVDYNDAPSGRRSFRRRGKPRRSVEFALANTAVDLNNVQADSPVPHYVTPDGSTPLAAVADTSRQIEGIVHRCTEQGLPTVYVSRLDKLSGSTTETLNEPLRWIYGRLRTNPRRDHVLGTEGVSEVERLNTVTVEEEI